MEYIHRFSFFLFVHIRIFFQVLVIAQEEEFPYMRPPLSKELWYNTDRDTTAQLRFNQWNGTQRR